MPRQCRGTCARRKIDPRHAGTSAARRTGTSRRASRRWQRSLGSGDSQLARQPKLRNSVSGRRAIVSLNVVMGIKCCHIIGNMPHSYDNMSKRSGRIQRAITAIFDSAPDNAFTIGDLCEKVYGVSHVERKHRVSVLRAAKHVAERRDTLRSFRFLQGRTWVYFNICSPMSYAMAWLKSDYIFHYRRKKRGLTRSGCSENELRSMLLGKHKDKRHDYRDWIKPGGAAWIAVQSWKAELKARRE